jgi:hypothetical protein
VEETTTIPTTLFRRMSKALIGIEKVLQEQDEINSDWVSEEKALQLLGCKRTKLFTLKEKGEIKYKKTGRDNLYSKKSIVKYNNLVSS